MVVVSGMFVGGKKEALYKFDIEVRSRCLIPGG